MKFRWKIRVFQGTGKSKKEAKIAGARRAFAALLDLDEEAFDTKFAGKTLEIEVSQLKMIFHSF